LRLIAPHIVIDDKRVETLFAGIMDDYTAPLPSNLTHGTRTEGTGLNAAEAELGESAMIGSEVELSRYNLETDFQPYYDDYSDLMNIGPASNLLPLC
jgi:hypothetical protein